MNLNILSNIADILSNIADILSIISFFVSICTLCLTKRIKKELLSRANINRRKKHIKDSIKDLAQYLNDYNSSKSEIKDLILKVKARITHLKNIDNKDLSKHINNLTNKIEEYDKVPSEDKAREIKTQLSIIKDELDEQEEVYKLGGH